MCRFMAVKSESPIDPHPFLASFAEMCRNSKSYDGDWQGDGWGVGTVSHTNGKPRWLTKKSLRPIWEEADAFRSIPDSRMILAHARSASFPEHKGIMEFCQPFVGEEYAFVFNGLLKGVSLPFAAEGRIGSQKMWSILHSLLKGHSPSSAFECLITTMKANTRSIQAMNIGACDADHIYVYSYFTRHPEYYRLHQYSSTSLKIVCSEPLEGFDFFPVVSGNFCSL